MVDRAGEIPGAVGPQADGIFMALEAVGCVVVRTSAHFRQPITVCTGLSVFYNIINI